MIKKNKDTYYKERALHYINEAKMQQCNAAVHVEACSDEFFWRKIFNRFFPNKRFNFITYSKTKDNNKATGCEICLKYKKLGCLSKEFFICIDSDYRYLLQEKKLNPENFVFQTYTYSIENHWCYEENINKVFEKAGLQNTIFDFEYFLNAYSKTLYELFIYHLYSLSVGDKYFTKEKFRSFLNISKPGADVPEMINELKEKVSPEILKLRLKYPNINIKELEEKYYELGLKKENAYLYFRGHNVFEQVVSKIALAVKGKLQKQQHTNQLSKEDRQKYYDGLYKEDFISYFSEDLYFGTYDEIIKIEKDIQRYFNQ